MDLVIKVSYQTTGKYSLPTFEKRKRVPVDFDALLLRAFINRIREKLLLAGRKRENIEILYFWKHIALIPTKVENERPKVTIKWLVVVNE